MQLDGLNIIYMCPGKCESLCHCVLVGVCQGARLYACVCLSSGRCELTDECQDAD